MYKSQRTFTFAAINWAFLLSSLHPFDNMGKMPAMKALRTPN